MCLFLGIARSLYYSFKEKQILEDGLTKLICAIFRDNYKAYGTRRIQIELSKLNHRVSRRRIARIMRSQGLISCYTKKNTKLRKMR